MNDKLHSLGSSFVYLLVLVGSSAVALLALALLGLDQDRSCVGLLSGLLTAAAALWLLHGREPGFYKTLPTRRGLLLTLSLSTVVTFLVQCIPAVAPAEVQQSLQGSGYYGQPAVDFASTVLVAPLAEELVFRGLILDELCRSFPTWVAVVLSGGAFGLLHGHLLWAFMAFCMALFYAWLRLRSKSLYLPVFAHMLSNLLAFLVNYGG